MRVLAVVLVSASLASCSHPPYSCTVDTQCVDGTTEGRCEPQGYCSFPDSECPSGSRFEPGAGNDLGGTCVPENNLPLCGAADQACCDDGGCLGNSFCDDGTCKQCVTDVAHGLTHSCFLRYDSTIWCAGINESGQLGNGGSGTLPTPTPVQVRDSTNSVITDAIALGNGGLHSCAIRADRTVWCWGHNDVCNSGSQLGNGSQQSSDVAVQVIRDSDGQPLTDVAEVYGSFCHTCARDMAGGVWCWGDNFAGQLGDGTIDSREAAVQVRVALGGAPFTGATSLVVGDAHNCVRTEDDEVFCWGRNQSGELGIGDTSGAQRNVPTKIDQLTAIALSSGRFHVCAIEPDHTISCWGSNKHGRLGNGAGERASDSENQFSPVRVLSEIGGTAFGDAAQIEGGAMSCAITTGGGAFCWGMNAYGQTGNAGQFVPAPVLDSNGAPLQQVTRIVGRYHRACAFRATGELVCWGRNDGGQLGDGTLVNHGLATPGAGPTCP